MSEYTPDLDRLHITWALIGVRRRPSQAPHFTRVIRAALARLRQHGYAYQEK